MITQGTIQNVTVYFETSGFDAKVAVYTDSLGFPSNLITQNSIDLIFCGLMQRGFGRGCCGRGVLAITRLLFSVAFG
jgi:hypothetical protein